MKTRTGLLICLFAVLVGYVASARITTTVGESPEIKIIPPSVDLAPGLAAFSGAWECNPHGILPSRLIIEEIRQNWATIVYTWADHPTGEIKAGWARVRARVVSDGKLQWGFPGKFTVEMAKDGMTITGKKEQAGKVSTFAMKKVGQLAAQ